MKWGTDGPFLRESVVTLRVHRAVGAPECSDVPAGIGNALDFPRGTPQAVARKVSAGWECRRQGLCGPSLALPTLVGTAIKLAFLWPSPTARAGHLHVGLLREAR
jgi:hypothetical protein